MEYIDQNRTKFLMLRHPLINYKIHKYYKKTKGVYNLTPTSMDQKYVINLDDSTKSRTN